MSLGQLLLTGVPGPELDSDTAARFKKLQPGGFILFGRNIKSPEQLRKLIDDLRDISDTGRVNCSLADTGGGLLLVSQFTLAADTAKGTRPSFTPAAPPDEAERLFNEVVALARIRHHEVATGEFGAEMTVSLVNHGPVALRLTA